ncbi:Clp protease ClpP [Aeribacillus composti]|uniref:Clp protease ClpP n=1 Tax=Aeribacillus composti TaxID=1868734 RepID=A0ABY9WD56_9BACI|nr:Clp protease ClpP [Aeribacillus composti]WNF33825.1 Clp protease ClpP [Aeribacillus composti]
MGIFTEYLEKNLTFEELNKERKRQLKRISELRGGRDILVYAADLNKNNAPISIVYDDLLAINDQLSNLSGDALDLILETPGGSGEVAEDIVKLIREKYNDVAVIVPGWSKSAGTIIAMSCDAILMEPASALGPIDAQITRGGKTFSADALIKGMEEIKDEVTRTGILNKAYIPILQGISPGELQGAQNALNFAKELVREWLVKYKFKDWNFHSSDGSPVTYEEKLHRAEEIASELADHSKWLTHGRSIKIDDLERMKLKIDDYSQNLELADAIRRYYTLLKMTLDTNIYKVFETIDSQIFKAIHPPSQPPGQPNGRGTKAVFDLQCRRCNKIMKIQANLGQVQPLESGHIPFPPNNILECPGCGEKMDLTPARKDIQSQTGLPIV